MYEESILKQHIVFCLFFSAHQITRGKNSNKVVLVKTGHLLNFVLTKVYSEGC